jgi:CBS domain-containing protein
VGDVMARDCATAPGSTVLRRFVDEQLLRVDARCFAVTDDGRMVGLIGPDDVMGIDRERWEYTTVAQAMRPLEALHQVTPDTSASAALELMGREHINQLPVVSEGRLQGVVTRSYLMQLWQMRRELMA